MNKWPHVGFLVILTSVANGASAQTGATDISTSGNRYVEICSSIERPVDRANAMDVLNSGICQGFMLGIEDGAGLSLSMLKATNNSVAYLKGSLEDPGVCFPNRIELGQMIRVTLKYIREHPEQAHLPSAELVILAFYNASPCAVPPQGNPVQKP